MMKTTLRICKVAMSFCVLILATASFVTTGVVAVFAALSLPEGVYSAGTPLLIVISVFVTVAFATWGLVNASWPE